MDRRVELERARSLLEMGARALIVTGLDHEPELTGLAKRFGAPVVATSIYEASASMPTIGYDNVELGRQAMQHLLTSATRMSPWSPDPRRRTTEPVSEFVARNPSRACVRCEL